VIDSLLEKPLKEPLRGYITETNAVNAGLAFVVTTMGSEPPLVFTLFCDGSQGTDFNACPIVPEADIFTLSIITHNVRRPQSLPGN
jgi:hypothetical protein